MITVSDNLTRLAKDLEGLPGGRPALSPYLDIGGKPTWGYGHTGPDVPWPANGAKLTPEQADILLRADLIIALDGVDDAITVSLNNNQRDALALFVLNEGAERLKTSTLARMINAGETAKAAKEFDRWVYYHDLNTKKAEISAGLISRRATEKALFLTPWQVQDVAPQAQPATSDGQQALPPPQPTRVTQTSTGRVSIGVIVAGVTGAATQARDMLDAVHGAFNSASPSVVVLLAIGAMVAGAGWLLYDRHRRLQETGS